MKIECDISDNFSEQEKSDILDRIDSLRNELEPEFEDCNIVHVPLEIEKACLCSDRKLDIFVCNVVISIMSSIETWLGDLTETYDAINNKENFAWCFPLCNSFPSIVFDYQTDHYLVKLQGVERSLIRNKTNVKEEKVDINQLKTMIDDTRQMYINFIKINFGNKLDGHLELLNLTFNE